MKYLLHPVSPFLGSGDAIRLLLNGGPIIGADI